MALWDIYYVAKFLFKVSNKVSCNFFYEDNNFLLLRLIYFAFLPIIKDVSMVVITALSQKNFESNLGTSESRELFAVLYNTCTLPYICMLLSYICIYYYYYSLFLLMMVSISYKTKIQVLHQHIARDGGTGKVKAKFLMILVSGVW